MLLAEWWGWEINLFLAGWTCPAAAGAAGAASSAPNVSGGGGDTAAAAATCVALDVFPICSNTMVICFFVHMGFSVAAAAHVGNLLGEGNARRARVTAVTATGYVALLGAAIAVVLLAVRAPWIALFTSDGAVGAEAMGVFPLVALYILFDAVGPGAMNNILRAVNHVKGPALINVASFYLLGIPIGVVLAFGLAPRSILNVDAMGIYGLWVGLNVGMVTMVLGLVLYSLRCVNWTDAAAAAVAAAASKAPGSAPTDGTPTPTPLARVGSIELARASPDALAPRAAETYTMGIDI
jgi:MATE family multidrug resistance protein